MSDQSEEVGAAYDLESTVVGYGERKQHHCQCSPLVESQE